MPSNGFMRWEIICPSYIDVSHELPKNPRYGGVSNFKLFGEEKKSQHTGKEIGTSCL